MYIYVHIYIYIYIYLCKHVYIYVYIGGWDCESNWEIVSFRACVRACERARRGEAKLCVRVRRCCFRGWVADAEFVLRGVAWREPPPWFGRASNLFVCQVCWLNRCSWVMKDDI